MLKLSTEQIQKRLNREKRLITLLFIISTTFGSVLVFLARDASYFYPGVFCYFLSIISLPKINRTKQDMKDVAANKLVEVSGKVAGYFPEKEGRAGGRWIAIIETQDDTYEYFLDQDIGLEEGVQAIIKTTKYSKIPVEIEATVLNNQ